MSSQKQLDANRANAQKSTGPLSPESKAKTRLNAKRDGITGQVITLPEEDLPVFEKLKAELIAELAPKAVPELRLASSSVRPCAPRFRWCVRQSPRDRNRSSGHASV